MIMGYEALKLELIEWLQKLEDKETIEYLKSVKDSKSVDHDWWDDLTKEQKKGIERGLKDIDNGRTVPHEEVKRKYGI
jgi:predicted transcriptional regulator